MPNRKFLPSNDVIFNARERSQWNKILQKFYILYQCNDNNRLASVTPSSDKDGERVSHPYEY